MRKLVLNYAKRHLWKVICEAWKKNKGEGGGVNTPSCIIPPSLFPCAPSLRLSLPRSGVPGGAGHHQTQIWKCHHNGAKYVCSCCTDMAVLWPAKCRNIIFSFFLTQGKLHYGLSVIMFFLYWYWYWYWWISTDKCVQFQNSIQPWLWQGWPTSNGVPLHVSPRI